MSFADFTANEMWYEKYMEHRPITKCEQCSHACVCWKVGMDAAQYCKVFESKTKNTVSMKLKELLPYIDECTAITIRRKTYYGEGRFGERGKWTQLEEEYGEKEITNIVAYGINDLLIYLEEEE